MFTNLPITPALKLFCLLALTFSLTACSWLSPYKQPIQQGNIYDAEQLEQLKTGMTPEQVTYLLGSPLLTAPNNPLVWDYLYQLRRGVNLEERKKLRLIFTANAAGQPAILDSFTETQAKITK